MHLQRRSKSAPNVAGETHPGPPAPTRRGGALWVVLPAVAVVGFVSLFVFRDGDRAGAAIDTYEVVHRSFPIKLNEKGELKAKNSVSIRCELEGRSTIISLVPEGSQAKKGDLLVRLSSNDIDERVQTEQIKVQNAQAAAEAADKELDILLDQNASDIRQAELKLHNARVELDKYVQGDYVQNLTDYTQAKNRAIKILEQKQSIVKDSKTLWEKKFLSKREYDQHVLDLDEAQVNLTKAKLALEIFEKYTHPKDLGQRESDISEAEKELERTIKQAEAKEAKQRANTAAKHSELKLVTERLNKYLDQQKKTELYAPADGLVVYDTGENHWSRREIREGAEVFERQGIISLPDVTTMQVKVRIHESKTNQIAVGQRAIVEVEGLPGVKLEGTVEKIAPLADSQNRWLNPDLKEYDAEITLDPNEYPLKPGVTARAEIFVDNVENALAVPIQAVYSSGSSAYVFVGDSQRSSEPKVVQLGRSNSEFVEILDGLNQGDQVLLAISDMMIARLPDQTRSENQDAGESPTKTKAITKNSHRQTKPKPASHATGGQQKKSQGSGESTH